MNVVVAANMGVNGFDMSPNFQHAGTWYDYFSGESFEVTNPGGHTFTFAPGEYRVFTSKPIDKTFYIVNVNLLEHGSEIPIDGALVTLTGSGSRLTESDGNAAFYSLSGNQLITIEKQGFESYEHEIFVHEDFSFVVYLTPNSTESNSQKIVTFNIYPNPSSGTLTVEASPNSWLYIFDLQGRLVFSKKLYNQYNSLDISTLGNGIFIAKVQNEDAFHVKKLIITKP